MSIHYHALLGDQVPQRGNAFSRFAGGLLLKLMGWRIVGQMPNVPKLVVIAAPHTSNLDGFVAVCALFSLNLRLSMLGKHTLFKGPLAPLMRWLGIVPVNRAAAGGMVAQSVAQFEQHDRFWLGIAPEGTRHNASEWKIGFHRIALAAQVPVLPVILDYGRKEIRLTETLMPSADAAADLAAVLRRYAGVQGRRSDRMSEPLRRP